MNLYAVIGGSIWGNRGAEAMVTTTIGRVRELDVQASFVIMTYFPTRDRALVEDPTIEIVSATPAYTILQFFFALLCRMASLVGFRVPSKALPNSVRLLRECRAIFDVSGVSFHDGRLAVVAYNLFCLWPAMLLRVPVIRLSQAMGPFENLLNRIPARWVFKRSLHSFARGRHTAGFIEALGVPHDSWSVAPDVAFSFKPDDSLTDENEARVSAVSGLLESVRATGTRVVALLPSSLVDLKVGDGGGDYVGLLASLIRELHEHGCHVVVLPNATREGEVAARNNDLVVISELRDRIAPMEVAGQLITYVDFDLNTRSIRALIDGSSLVITSRFHAMVAGLALGIPTMVIGWSHKYDEVLESFGSSDYAIDFSEADERLIPMAFDLLENGDEVRRKISTVLPGVIEASRAQFEVVNELSASS